MGVSQSMRSVFQRPKKSFTVWAHSHFFFSILSLDCIIHDTTSEPSDKTRIFLTKAQGNRCARDIVSSGLSSDPFPTNTIPLGPSDDKLVQCPCWDEYLTQYNTDEVFGVQGISDRVEYLQVGYWNKYNTLSSTIYTTRSEDQCQGYSGADVLASCTDRLAALSNRFPLQDGLLYPSAWAGVAESCPCWSDTSSLLPVTAHQDWSLNYLSNLYQDTTSTAALTVNGVLHSASLETVNMGCRVLPMERM